MAGTGRIVGDYDAAYSTTCPRVDATGVAGSPTKIRLGFLLRGDGRPEETETAELHAVLATSTTPFMLWNDVAQQFAAERSLSLVDTARVTASRRSRRRQARSRIYGGIHFAFELTDSHESCRRVADWVLDNYAVPQE